MNKTSLLMLPTSKQSKKHDRQSKALQQWGDFAKNYNERSNIPLELIKDIYQVTQQYLTNPKDAPSERFLF